RRTGREATRPVPAGPRASWSRSLRSPLLTPQPTRRAGREATRPFLRERTLRRGARRKVHLGMGIVDDDVARVRGATDPVALAGEHLALKRSGRRWVGLCPFHPEKTPSFSINPEQGVYYCFGCQASGDAITFVREVEHLDFVGAVERLATRAGIQLRYDDANYSQDRKRRDRLNAAVAAAIAFYHQRLMTAQDAGL